MQIAASEAVSRLCISSIRNSAPAPWLGRPRRSLVIRSVRSCSGSPESAIAGGGLHVELELHAGGHRDAEGLDHAQCAVDAVLDPVLAAHLAQQPRGHPRERDAEVGLRADLLDVGGRPARLGREHVELHQQHRLADAAQARVDQAALVAAGAEPLDQRLEVLEVAVAAGEVRRLASGAGV